jgi:hypothetical protein
MAEKINLGIILVKEGTLLPASVCFESEPYTKGWGGNRVEKEWRQGQVRAATQAEDFKESAHPRIAEVVGKTSPDGTDPDSICI